MPLCPECRAEKSGNFCPDCGTRLLKPKGPRKEGFAGEESNVNPSPRQSAVAGDVMGLVSQYKGVNMRKRMAMVSSSCVGTNRISVAVRKRPLNPAEGGLDIISVDSLNTLRLLEPRKTVDGTRFIEPHEFFFDEVFDENDTNDEVYKRTAKRLISYVYDGGYCSCFAYGQTGSGKTYTMMGTGSKEKGLYLQASDEIFSKLEPNLGVSISFYEIYASRLYDLLNNREPIFAREDENKQVHIRGLSEHPISSSNDMMTYVKRGLENRSQSATTMNDESSRSHAILDIKLKLISGKIIGKLSVVDLAGSERAAVGHAGDKQVQMEGAEINKSLLALKECIRALDQGAKHVPFRQSELTQILKESFVGDNGHTTMIANISPSSDSCIETLNTLRYAYRIKGLKVEEHVKKKFSAGSADGPSMDFSQTTSSSNQIKNAQGDLISHRKEKPKCPGCGLEKRNLAALEAHKESCTLVTIQCPHCSTAFKRKDQEKHNKACSKFPVECKLCKDPVPREGLKKHQSVDCPKGETSCLFCRMKLAREELESHKPHCEQRIIDCEDCGAKVKFSQMTGHKRTCKKGKRESGASQTPPPSSGEIGKTGSMGSLAGRGRAKEKEKEKEKVETKPLPEQQQQQQQQQQQPITETVAIDANNATATTTASTPISEVDAPQNPSPTPPPVATKRPSRTHSGNSNNIQNNGQPSAGGATGCPFKELGCAAQGCDSDVHVGLLLKENMSLRKDLAAMNYRVELLEKMVSGNGVGTGHPSKFAVLNGLNGIGGINSGNPQTF